MRIARQVKPVKLLERLDKFETYFAEKEPHIHAFLPEAGRFARLRREAMQLAGKHRKPEQRSELFGLLLGVKDMFHVDGFATHAGSRLPPRELSGKEAWSVTRLKNAGMLIAGTPARLKQPNLPTSRLAPRATHITLSTHPAAAAAVLQRLWRRAWLTWHWEHKRSGL
jgi:hypothetical protein